MILAFEMTGAGVTHAPVNTALLLTASLAYPGRAIRCSGRRRCPRVSVC